MSNKELKEKYNELFNLVKKSVNYWDPIGLLPSAPDDEYDMEIGRIVALLGKVDSINTLAEGIDEIFTKAFDWSFTKEECLPIAQKIWEDVRKI
ncbi:DUF1871 family protein [Neobacillus sp. NPDC097160]|uniref:DUF1871 family protein n=1 Tax=Neobacillus sp. NPDC097160 TaxID=3364298 RepID=UPI003803515F